MRSFKLSRTNLNALLCFQVHIQPLAFLNQSTSFPVFPSKLGKKYLNYCAQVQSEIFSKFPSHFLWHGLNFLIQVHYPRYRNACNLVDAMFFLQFQIFLLLTLNHYRLTFSKFHAIFFHVVAFVRSSTSSVKLEIFVDWEKLYQQVVETPKAILSTHWSMFKNDKNPMLIHLQ